MPASKRPRIVADGDQHDVDEHQLRHDPCGKANDFAPPVPKRNKSKHNV